MEALACPIDAEMTKRAEARGAEGLPPWLGRQPTEQAIMEARSARRQQREGAPAPRKPAPPLPKSPPPKTEVPARVKEGKTCARADERIACEEETGEEDNTESFVEQKMASPQGASAGADQDTIMGSQAARDHVFPILIKELVKEEIMGAEDGTTLLDLYKAGSPVVNGALDVYDLDSDMGELVDTLQNTVRTVPAQ